MNKRFFAAFLMAVLCVFAFSACTGKVAHNTVQVKEASLVSADNDTQEQIKEVLDKYFSAISSHDHIGIVMCTNESFIWNYDETSFMDYCRNISGFENVNADFSAFSEIDGEYSVPVSYTVSLFVDPDNADGAYQNISKTEVFYFIQSDETYVISSVSSVVVG